MLGQAITIYLCLLGYYNKPAEITHFKIIGGSHEIYFIHGLEYASVSCNHTIKGMSMLGNKLNVYLVYLSVTQCFSLPMLHINPFLQTYVIQRLE